MKDGVVYIVVLFSGGLVSPGTRGGVSPDIPPRNGDAQDRVLSVSGKKKCSACKDELGNVFFLLQFE